MNHEPIAPALAVELFIADKEAEYRWATLKSYQSRLRYFTRWCDERGISNCNELTGRLLHEYRIWRRSQGEYSPATQKTHLDSIRVFIRWLGTIDGVDPDLHLKVRSPKLTPDENSRSVTLEQEDAEAMLAYLERFEYASTQHVALSLLWHTMLRLGAIYALDLDDYDREERFLSIVHRPDTGTPIKNGNSGQRLVALSGEICTLLDDYILGRRKDETDEYGRKPLLTSVNGRMSKNTIRGYCYDYSRPCMTGQDCPHGRERETCEFVPSDKSSKCPSSVSPHPFRRGGITHYLANDVPETTVSQRANVSPDVIEQHYNQRTAKEKMEQRRQYLGNI